MDTKASTRTSTRTKLAVCTAASMLLLAGCGDGDEDSASPEVEAGEESPDDDADVDTGDDTGDDAGDDTGDETGDDTGDDADEPAEPDTGGTVTVDGATADLERTWWCNQDFDDRPESVSYFGHNEDDLQKIVVSQETLDDGTNRDVVTIYPVEMIEHSLGDGSGTVTVDEGEDGFPLIEVDGDRVVVDGEDEVAFSAEFTIPDEETDQATERTAFCDQ